MDAFKNWALEVGVKQFGPSFIRGSVLSLVAYLAARNSLIPGVQTDSATHITTIAWDQVSAWAVAGIPALAGMIKVLNYHGIQMVTPKAPESIPPSA